MPTITPGYKILDTIGKKVIVSIDSDVFDVFCENIEMSQNHQKLQNQYARSADSGRGMTL